MFSLTHLYDSKSSSKSGQNELKWSLQTGFYDILDKNKWPLVVVDRWSLSKGSFSTKITWAGFRVVVVERWSLLRGGR